MKAKKITVLLTATTMLLGTGITANAKDVSDYSDVHNGDWFYNPVAYVSEQDLMTGMNDTTFAPSVDLSRAQLAVILYRMAAKPGTGYAPYFPDVKDGQFYSEAVTWAYGSGVIKGYNDGRFGPGDKITREQLATMLYRYAGSAGYDTSAYGDTGAFPDGWKVSAFSADSMAWAAGAGIITGEGSGNLNPQGSVSRAVAATMVSRLKAQETNPVHVHEWKEHVATKSEWVPDIVTVDDYETQKVCVGSEWHCNCGAVISISELEEHAVNHILAGEPDNGYDKDIIETQTVKVGSHTEDHGSYQDVPYTDYYYCDCGAIK